ncbi:protein NPAT [Cheilinus undulatus]|uniref:protein NPAT n=1 Tax=Cheilinus undulatus TaxID=241271 RepID=UPI001BD5D9D2|nr:protein NPAT [Cheilinus undulatus]XP_041665094.1 protein NPAT [Cheilinus undulatus]
MLLPSDVARLVLGYLQDEGLSATSQAFINESPNLKEYADHTTGDGTIPACVFSVFGKGLTTILNEYVAAKTKESCHEVPAMMTSLWKKLDFTLNQIKSLQNSPALSASQRTRSRVGLANMARQRVLTLTSASAVVCSSVSDSSSIISPAHTSHSMLGHSTPVSYSTPYTRPATSSSTHTQIHDIGRLVSTPRDSPVQIIVSEHRLNPGPMSPGRRKWDTPRKRSGAPSGSSGPARCAVASSSQSTESQPEEVVDENFPQLVIQNARDKILGDRSLQEKLAENINKILASDQTPQASKPSTSTVEADQSIDEILGLQGEIHMSDDAIHDILEQTESDPAFQALFDLFDYNKTKSPEEEAEDGNVTKGPDESNAAGASAAVRPLQSEEPGTAQKEGQTTTPSKTRTPDPKERKTRKPPAPTLIKKIVCAPGSRSSRIENSSARLLLAPGMQQGVSSAEKNSNRKVPASLPNKSVSETPMDIDEPLNTPPAPSDIVAPQEPAPALTTAVLSDLTTVPSSRASAAFVLPELTLPSNMDKDQDPKQIQGSKEQSAPCCTSAPSNPPACLTSVQDEVNNAPTKTSDLPHMLISSSADTQQVFTPSSASSTSSTYATGTAVCALPSPASSFPSLMTSGLPTPATTSTDTPAPSASPASIPSYAPVVATPDPSSDNPTTPSKAAADSNIVSLKIIIDNQDEHSSSDTALNQAISSISGENIPTIYLSSPVKSPAVPVTPKASLDEAALAVSGLQSSEGHASPLSIKTGAVVASPLTGTSQAQQNYIIQLPLDSSSHAIQGAAASYYLVTDPPTTDTQTRQVLLSTGISKGQSMPTNQYGVTPPTCSPGFSTGSTFILPSTVKPMMLPVSVVGQKTLGAVQVVPNQLVAISNPVPVQQSQNTPHKNPKVAIRKSKTAGTEKHPVDKLAQPVSAEATAQQNSTKAPKHRRILCFDSSAEVQQTAKVALPPATKKSPSQPVQQTGIDNSHSGTRTKPNILSGSKPKRRVHPVRCSADSQAGAGFVKEAERLVTPQHQKDPAQKSPGQQESQSASTSKGDESTLEPLKKSDSGRKSQSTDRKHGHDKDAEDAMAKDSHRSRSSSSDTAPKSGARKEKEDGSKKDQVEKASAKPREGHTEKRTSSQGVPHVTANKENEIKGSTQEQSTSSSSASRDLSSPAGTQSTSNTQSKATKAPSKTSSLAKQAAEMLQDIQAHNSPSTPVKRPGPGAGSSDPSLPSTPGTGVSTDDLVSCVRTPSRQKKGKDREGTPKHLMPPNTPDAPTCSPASEAGSENSINMAAHTLMILSRAAIARTGSPLKDSLRQEGVGEKSSTSSKTAKKRKPTSPAASPPAKKDRERKKLVDCFPHDLDVDKFLSSLHYDE